MAAVLSGCAAPVPAPRAVVVVPALTRAQNAFALDLFGQLARAPGNVFFAPYSVSTALGMVFVGARGETAAQMAAVLHLDGLAPGGDDLAGIYATDVSEQPALGDGYADGSKFETANALWGARHYDFNGDYIATIRDDFGGDLRRVNFDDAQGAADRINGWVDTATHGKIPTLISPDMLMPPPKLVLTNAVYFKAGWDEPFDPDATRRAVFHTAADGDVQAETMTLTNNLIYAAGDGVQVLRLDYRYNDTSMVIILPDAKDGLRAMEAGLTPVELDGLLANPRSPLVHVTLPKFSADSTVSLVPDLQALGMTRLFEPKSSDLSGIADHPADRIYVSDVIHKAHLDVDEIGTEAAAVTAVIGPVAAGMRVPMPPPPPPIEFIANHPFLYLIRDNRTGEILFMGRVDNPLA